MERATVTGGPRRLQGNASAECPSANHAAEIVKARHGPPRTQLVRSAIPAGCLLDANSGFLPRRDTSCPRPKDCSATSAANAKGLQSVGIFHSTRAISAATIKTLG